MAMNSMNRSFWGSGPRIFRPMAITLVITALISLIWPEVFVLSLPAPPCIALGAVMILSGVALIISGATAIKESLASDTMLFVGVYSQIRHPMYSAWITLIVPGLAVLFQAWPIFLASVVGFISFCIFIKEEETILVEKFGSKYIKYKKQVGAILPKIIRKKSATPPVKADISMN